MRKGLAALGSAVFFVLAPGLVAGVAPWWITGRWTVRESLGWPLQILGVVLIAASALASVDSRFRGNDVQSGCTLTIVIPAKAGIHRTWVPACAGTTAYVTFISMKRAPGP